MPSTRASKKRSAETLDDVDGLEHEMELLAPGNAVGKRQPRRRPNRNQYHARRKLRKMLETNEEAPQGEDTIEHLRGSKAAAEEKVIAGSLIFGIETSKEEQAEDANAAEDDEASIEGETNDQDDDDGDEMDFINPDDDDQSDEEDNGSNSAKKPSAKSSASKGQTKGASGRSRKRNRIQRMKSFRSAKMAERHGEALSAHIRGKPALAIRKLKRLAKDVPSAPQIYSSLGMVYHDLFAESKQKEGPPEDQELEGQPNHDRRSVSFADEKAEVNNASDRHVIANETQDLSQEQLEYGKKAYASYHIAACLCKRDAALWERSGDAALDVAALHSRIITIPKIGLTVSEFHRTEKQRWLEEAKNDLQAADALNPPGISLPTKLAQVMIDLGLLSEALTLLTDVKEKKDFGASYEAWQLYADLMLRIGYECKLWNEGTQTNENYMFRRWLRKHSQSFDWQERRLQALVKALEAASGTDNCIVLLNWMKDRAVSNNEDQPAENDGDNANEDQVLLEQAIVEELAAFDKTTLEMELAANSLEAKERQQARDDIVLRHSAMRSDEADGQKGSTSIHAELLPQENDERLRFTASIQAVRVIASELMRSLLALDLHVGARHVGDTVSSYLIDRMKERKPGTNRGFFDPQENSTTSYAMEHKTYDEGGNSENDDDKSVNLSDEEDLEALPLDEVESLEKGILPPDTRFLYGLALAKGGKLALASHCLKAIVEFPCETSDWLRVNATNTGLFDDPEWVKHEFVFKEPFGRSVALAYLSDALDSESLTAVLRITGPIYHQHVARLQGSGLIDAALSEESTDPRFQLRRALLVKTMMTNLYQQLVVVDVETNFLTLKKAIESVSFILAAVWRPDQISSITTTIVDLMSAFERIVSFCIKTCDESLDSLDDCLDLTKTLAKPIGLLCGVLDFRLNEQVATDNADCKNFPIRGQWISQDLWPVALRSFNLCVATNVSQFSGWEQEEFSLRLLRKNRNPSFFGITMEAGHVAGFLNESIQSQLVHLWQTVEEKVVGADFDFKGKLEVMRESDWYKKVRERQFAAEAKNPIVHEAEDRALSSFLRFSRMCLKVFDPSSSETEKFLHVAMSIILPISQFVLNESLWDVPIGTAALSPSFKGWKARLPPEDKPCPPYKVSSRLCFQCLLKLCSVLATSVRNASKKPQQIPVKSMR